MRLLKFQQVVEMVGVGRSQIYRKIGTGDFPAPVKVGPKSIRFRADDVEAWISNLPVHVDLRKDGQPGEAR